MKTKKISYYFERFKAILLVVLIGLCIIQVGILWSSQSGSFPTYFISHFFPNLKSTSQITVEEAKGKYMLPYRVVLSAGFNDDHYLIANGSQEYDTLWNGAKEYIPLVLNSKVTKIVPFVEANWANIVANKPYTFEFKTQIPIEIVRWVLNLDPKASSGDGPDGIYKISICPDDPDNNYSDTLYIISNNNIYIYSISNYNGNALSKAEFREIYERLRSKNNTKNYQMAIEQYPNLPFSQDMLMGPQPGTIEQYPEISGTPLIDKTESHTISEYNQVGTELFGKDSTDYDPDEDINGSVVFKKADNVYRLYKQSVLEYKFAGSDNTPDKTSLVDAYNKAIGFIIDHSRQSNFMSNVSVYLKSIIQKQNQNSYVFNFDFTVSIPGENGEVPLFLDNYPIGSGGKTINDCLSIEANSKRVTYCTWLVLNYKASKSKGYEWTFTDMHNKVLKINPKLQQEDLYVKDFGIYYILRNKPSNQIISPSFVLFTKNGNYGVSIDNK